MNQPPPPPQTVNRPLEVIREEFQQATDSDDIRKLAYELTRAHERVLREQST